MRSVHFENARDSRLSAAFKAHRGHWSLMELLADQSDGAFDKPNAAAFDRFKDSSPTFPVGRDCVDGFEVRARVQMHTDLDGEPEVFVELFHATGRYPIARLPVSAIHNLAQGLGACGVSAPIREASNVKSKSKKDVVVGWQGLSMEFYTSSAQLKRIWATEGGIDGHGPLHGVIYWDDILGRPAARAINIAAYHEEMQAKTILTPKKRARRKKRTGGRGGV